LNITPFLVFSIFIPISHRLDKKKKTSKQKKQLQKKKNNFQITLLNDLFFSIFILIMGQTETNKQKKSNFQRKNAKRLCKRPFFFFFVFFRPKLFGERCCCCSSLRHFIATKFLFFCASARIVMAPNVYAKGEKKKHQRFVFFRVSSQSRLVIVDVRFDILLQPTFVFAQRLFCCY
jgi:hypothetical protein